MNYSLAHDEEGMPLEVPETATGWLVRRHAGGRGRPGAVYDADGRPLVVALEATTAELREAGCKPGSYRLDAVDAARRPLQVVAYTELAAADGEVDGEAGKPAADAAVMALARAVEAMQRVQAERERVQAEMFAKLIDRLTPAPVQPVPIMPDLRNAVLEAAALKKMLDEMAVAARPGEAAGEGGEDDGEEEADFSPIERLCITIAPLIDIIVRTYKGAATAAAVAAPVTAVRNGAEGDAEAVVAEDMSEEARAKLNAVFSKLTPEELALAKQMIKAMPPDIYQQAKQHLLTMSTEEAATGVRMLLQQYGHKLNKPAKA